MTTSSSSTATTSSSSFTTTTTTTITDILPREALAYIVGYLTTKEKQRLIDAVAVYVAPDNKKNHDSSTSTSSTVVGKVGWIRAVQDEMRSIIILPDGDSQEGMDINRSLNFVRDYCPNLEYFSLRIPRNLMLQGGGPSIHILNNNNNNNNGVLSAAGLMRSNNNNNNNATHHHHNHFQQWFLTAQSSYSSVTVPTLTFGGKNLANAFITSTTTCGASNSLQCFRLHFDESCRTETFHILREANGIRFLLNCQKLQILDCNYLALASMEQIAEILSAKTIRNTLRVIKLDNLGFLLNSPLWPDPTVMTKAIGQIPNLQQLSLVFHQLRDTDIATLLLRVVVNDGRGRDEMVQQSLPIPMAPSLLHYNNHQCHHQCHQQLKSLTLQSDFYKMYVSLIGGGNNGNNGGSAGLTDLSMELISKQCPNLQHLDISGNPAITSVGIRKVLESCPALRELDASSCNVQILEWKELLLVSSSSSSEQQQQQQQHSSSTRNTSGSLSSSLPSPPPSLMLVAFNLSFSSPNTDTRTMEQEITSAIVATEGRVLFCETERRGIIKANEYSIDESATTSRATILQQQRDTASQIQNLIAQEKNARQTGQPNFYWNRINVFQEGAFARLGTIL